jgi:hypothetical protein
VLIGFDLLLVVVLGLLLYSISARDPARRRDRFDVVQVVLVVSALLADAVALWAIAARISEFGFTPNRVAALGENVILLVNLAWSAVLYIRFLRGAADVREARALADRLPAVYAGWAAVVGGVRVQVECCLAPVADLRRLQLAPVATCAGASDAGTYTTRASPAHRRSRPTCPTW